MRSPVRVLAITSVALGILAVGTLPGQDQDTKLAEAIDRIHAQIRSESLKLAEVYYKQGDLELAQMCTAIAAWSSTRQSDRDTIEEQESKYLAALHGTRDAKKLTRALPTALTSAARTWASKIELLARAAKNQSLGRHLEVLARQFGSLPELITMFRRLNDWRTAGGLRAVGWSQSLTYGCMLHARYMAHTDHFAHEERDTSEHFSHEGHKAARESALARGSDPAEAVDRWMATLYHRVMLIHPGIRRAGFGYWARANKYAAVNTCGDCVDDNDELVLYPAAGQRNVPLTFAVPERPDPIPEANPSPGYPFTLTFYGKRWHNLNKETKITGSLKDAAGNVIECYFSTPYKPANDDVPDNFRTVCLIPKRPLRPNTVYSVEITWTQGAQTNKAVARITTRQR